MCEFCVKHGEGKKWYLQAKNYGEDLASDLRRRKFIERFFNEMMRPGPDDALQSLRKLESAPALVRRFVSGLLSRRFKREHIGQVVPLEDVEKILDICNGIVRVPCVCRRLTREADARFCIALSINPHKTIFSGLVSDDYWAGPDGAGLETLTGEQASALMRDFERQGLCHSVWAFITPFIGGVCNCDRMDCLGLLYTMRGGVKVMFRGEYVAQIDSDTCRGCRACMRNCQFGAISFSGAAAKCVIDEQSCWGCGVCRAACEHDAIALQARDSVPAVAGMW
jgi:NAD-dependent dihydropyrimidine dehydrogenase PreA subunit